MVRRRTAAAYTRLRLQAPKLFGLGWFVLSLVALVMGLLLSWLTYMRSDAVLDVARPLIDHDIPMLRVIAELRSLGSDSERSAFEYYSTGEREPLRQRSLELGNAAGALLGKLEAATEDARTRELIVQLRALQDEAGQLAQSLYTTGNTPAARDDRQWLLNQISLNTRQRGDLLTQLGSTVQNRAESRGVATGERLRDIIRLVTVFSALLLLATLVIGYFLAAYLVEARERQRLALFPERNPNPVLSLDRHGAITYANPGARNMTRDLGLPSPVALLPDDLSAQIEPLRAGPDDMRAWEYPLGSRLIGINVHHLSDSDAFHVYLSDVTERKQAQAELEFQAFHDALTRLPNRRAFESRVSDALTAGQTGAVMLLGTDRFQPIIDSLGHAFADRVLCAIAARLTPLTENTTLPCRIHRFDGELFAALMPRITHATQIDAFASTIAEVMALPFLIDKHELFFSFSIGIASFPNDGQTTGELLRNADTALQAVKRAGGRAALGYVSNMGSRALELLKVEHDLRRAVERDELELHYQPQLDIGSGRIIGVEALLRWRHPTRGLIAPADFIPLAEETGAILDIGRWTLATACAQSRSWQTAGYAPMVMAVNISPRQFADRHLHQSVLDALHTSGLEAKWLELEITESAAMHDVDAAIASLKALKRIGVGLSIDDFGTGYSSLSYLKRFPIDKLKIDQSFVRHMADDASDAAITLSVVLLGHSLGLTVIAEGVETSDHLRMLAEYGCEQYQGYLFSRPLPVPDLERVLDTLRVTASSIEPPRLNSTRAL